MQRYRRNHPERKQLEKLYKQQHPEQDKTGKQRQARYRLNHPEKYKARLNADKNVLLGPCCFKCGSTEHLERHHPDYSKPLEVITLCRNCHQLVK